MKQRHFIGMDVHCKFSEVAAVTEAGRLTYQGQCATSIPTLVQELEKIPRPRHLVIEEGPLADWLWRNLREHVDEMVICNPRRNHLIAKEGDKDDPIDAPKLAQLYRGGYIKAVHHGDSLARSLLKQHVGLYHDRVRHRVSEALRAISLLRRHGVFVREKAFVHVSDRPALLERLPKQRVLRGAVAVASEIHRQKRECLGLEQHNWAFKKEDPFHKWEVQTQSPKERNPHGRQDYSRASRSDNSNRRTWRSA